MKPNFLLLLLTIWFIMPLASAQQPDPTAALNAYRKAEAAYTIGDYATALQEINIAAMHSPDALKIKELKEKILQAKKNADNEAGYKLSLASGDSAINQKNLQSAIKLYELALSYKPGDNTAIIKLKSAEEAWLKEQQYLNALSAADKLFGTEDFVNAANAYLEALKIKPDDERATIGLQNAREHQKLKEEAERPRTYTETVENISFKMIYVESGSFVMGNTWNEPAEKEKPAHEVYLTDFYIAENEVTVEQFRIFVQETNYVTDAEKYGASLFWNGNQWLRRSEINWQYDALGNKRTAESDKHPVIHVSWYDANAYCRWLSTKTGRKYRLPTEAEWEFAARGGNKSEKYKYSGSNKTEESAWYKINSGGSTQPVAQRKPNELGIYDMSGNIWEWCSDWFESYSDASVHNPTGAATGTRKVYRGGSWYDEADMCRVSSRKSEAPAVSSNLIGFRIAQDK